MFMMTLNTSMAQQRGFNPLFPVTSVTTSVNAALMKDFPQEILSTVCTTLQLNLRFLLDKIYLRKSDNVTYLNQVNFC